LARAIRLSQQNGFKSDKIARFLLVVFIVFKFHQRLI